ncbi:MBOAT, membrane-bound O-acyltransferase family-domain-containing protein [Mycotypha africana]|uniref:MBOAT, membrane-bound O-acyltransferase family-domain-containing protein n=1 Tax=Mycotypha africana TaxID=64632 RepID=UPI002300B3A8|nr:MBOAT, membrane-bound O-acyltransferase family-domain-containing protein [Mycotypha africana]KAI8991686.1 MBOAT, membrane-bound O-acyltransferase family-domain-containing protein [Mycotypha africana]
MMNDSINNSPKIKLRPSRWRTKEFYFYYFCFCIVVPYMFKVTHDLSKKTHPNYPKYESLLSKGWIFGRQVDNSDAQYGQFRDNIPKLLPLVFTHLIFNKANQHYQWLSSKLKFSLLSSIICILLLHGFSTLKIFFLVSINYIIGRRFKSSKWNPALTWAYNLFVLFINEYYDGYRFEHMFGSAFQWLDQWEGFQARWHILFNFAMLRLISFNMDYYWACNERTNISTVTTRKVKGHEKQVYELPHTDKERVVKPLLDEDYNYFNFLAYVLYTPLLLCGPIITFNDFISQFKYRSKNLTRRYIAFYTIRLIFVILLMEVILHYLYVVAISKAKAWNNDTPLELSMIGYFNLVIIWMKLLIPWRFFRLWSLMDGIWVEENMVRCMSNNFSAQRFWKSWHRTFNRWTIRYIYIPLGGSKYFVYSIWVVFTFVALWHDIELKLLAWGWLICLFLLPEIIASRIFTEKKYGDRSYYRFVCGMGAVVNILMMMIANLVGFAVGLDGIKELLRNIFGTVNGLSFLISVAICLFIAVQIMFEIREEEKRRGDPKWKM